MIMNMCSTFKNIQVFLNNVLPVSSCGNSLCLMVSPDICWKLLTSPLSLKVRQMLNLRMLVS